MSHPDPRSFNSVALQHTLNFDTFHVANHSPVSNMLPFLVKKKCMYNKYLRLRRIGNISGSPKNIIMVCSAVTNMPSLWKPMEK